MAAKKTTKKVVKKQNSKTAVKAKKTASPQKKQSSIKNLVTSLRFGESYTSLVLGIIAVTIATILLLSFFSNRQGSKPGEEATPTIADVETLNITLTPSPQQVQPVIGKTYTVVAGDNLWSIAEKAYGSGYNWVDIAKENKLSDPKDIHVGNKLSLPKVVTKGATVLTGEDEATVSRTMRIVNETYTITKGDDLWNIAVRAYGDGYQWVKIAKANNLTNPNIIHIGNTLKIPRG